MSQSAIKLLVLCQATMVLLLWQVWGPKPEPPPPTVIEPPTQVQESAEPEQVDWRGKALPEIVFRGPGGPLSTEAFSGDPLVIEFISTTCPYCQSMAPKFAEAIPGSGASFLVVSVAGESMGKLRRWHRGFLRQPMPGAYALDRDGLAVEKFSLQGTPTTFFVDRSGKIDAIVEGEFSQSELDRLLGKISSS